MSSMSTRIDDLPNEVYENSLYENTMYEKPDNTVQIRPELERTEPETNISMNIKKKVNFNNNVDIIPQSSSNDIWSYLKSEVTEENLLILVILYVSSISIINKQLRKIPFLSKFNNDLLINVVKIVIIFLVYILFKKFVLPKVKL